MKPLKTLTSLLAAAAITALAPAQETLRIGSWNLEHFGARNQPRTDDDVREIANFIRDLDVSVLAVQEIRTKPAIEKLVRATGPSWDYVLGTTGTFGGGGGIRIGFLFDTSKVELVHAEELLHLSSKGPDDIPIFHRKPVSAVFRAKGGGLDFRAITVHLKASRGAKNIAKRRAEVAGLRNYIEGLVARDGEDRDIVVLGDFNHTYRAPAHQDFGADQLVEYLRARGAPRTIVHFEEPIDHIAITRGLRDELVAKQLSVHGQQAAKDLTAWRRVYSDHIPVTCVLRNVDNDPHATFTPPGQDQWLAAGGRAAADGAPIEASVAKGAAGPTAGERVTIRYQDAAGFGLASGRVVAVDDDWIRIELERTAADAAARIVAFPRTRVIHVTVHATR